MYAPHKLLGVGVGVGTGVGWGVGAGVGLGLAVGVGTGVGVGVGLFFPLPKLLPATADTTGLGLGEAVRELSLIAVLTLLSTAGPRIDHRPKNVLAPSTWPYWCWEVKVT